MGKLSLPFITMATEADVIQGQKGQTALELGCRHPSPRERGGWAWICRQSVCKGLKKEVACPGT